MIKELTIQANKVAERARENASWSRSIPNAIGVGKAEKTASGYTVNVTVDLNESPEAAAFEYGSGEHGESGEPYVIEPINATRLVIPKKRWARYVPAEDENPNRDPLFFMSVLHPGVKAKPYLQPAIESTRAGFVSSIGKIFKQAYLDSTVKVTVISAKK